jgi:hypothetical protein
VDGLIVRPGECALSYAEFTCETASGRFNLTTCLSEEQVGTLRKIFSDWTDPIAGEVIFRDMRCRPLSKVEPGRPLLAGTSGERLVDASDRFAHDV